MATVIAYVDGFNLYHGLHDKYRRRYGLAGEQSVGLTPQTPRSPSWRASETDGLFRDDSIAAVHHWADLDAGLQEARRVLKPGGRLVAIERLTRPGATGLASHGWTPEQASAFADRCLAHGFTGARVNRHGGGRRTTVSVRVTAP